MQTISYFILFYLINDAESMFFNCKSDEEVEKHRIYVQEKIDQENSVYFITDYSTSWIEESIDNIGFFITRVSSSKIFHRFPILIIDQKFERGFAIKLTSNISYATLAVPEINKIEIDFDAYCIMFNNNQEHCGSQSNISIKASLLDVNFPYETCFLLMKTCRVTKNKEDLSYKITKEFLIMGHINTITPQSFIDKCMEKVKWNVSFWYYPEFKVKAVDVCNYISFYLDSCKEPTIFDPILLYILIFLLLGVCALEIYNYFESIGLNSD
ncbi:hypothetical protein ACKWTF_012416 [Chironomus riparius]